MAKTKDLVGTWALRVGNTVATPLRRGGEIGNAVANVLRQGQSSAKNTAEVCKQTIDSLVDNFLNFSKVEGKRYQRLTKWTINLASACTRRPAMIAGAGIASTINQWVRQPFKKLLYTPGKMFKGMRNATRIFSKKKGFDFENYDTHETGKDTRVQGWKEKKRGFLWGKGKEEKGGRERKWGKEEGSEKKPEVAPVTKEQAEKKIEKTVEKPKAEPKPVVEKSVEKPPQESDRFQKAIQEKDDKFIDKELAERGYPTWGILADTKKWSETTQAKSIDEPKAKQKAETQTKINNEIEAKKRKNLSKEDKEKYKKDFTTLLENNITEEGVLARAKKNKKGSNLDQILRTLDKEHPTFATFIDDEILAKKTPASAT